MKIISVKFDKQRYSSVKCKRILNRLALVPISKASSDSDAITYKIIDNAFEPITEIKLGMYIILCVI